MNGRIVLNDQDIIHNFKKNRRTTLDGVEVISDLKKLKRFT